MVTNSAVGTGTSLRWEGHVSPNAFGLLVGQLPQVQLQTKGN